MPSDAAERLGRLFNRHARDSFGGTILTFLRFIRLLSLGLWLGAFFFFAAAIAPLLFSVLPSRAMAGLVVGRALSSLHWLGLGCALVARLHRCSAARISRPVLTDTSTPVLVHLY